MAEQLPPSVLIYFCSVSTFDTYVIMLYFFWFCRLFPGCLQVIVTAVIWIPCHYGQFSINTDTFCGWQIINGCDCTYLEWNTYSVIAYSLCRVSWKTKSGKEKIKSWKEELINLKDDVLCLSEVVRVEEVQGNATLCFLIQYLMH